MAYSDSWIWRSVLWRDRILKFNVVLLRGGARTPSESETDCAISAEPDLGEEPVPRKTRYYAPLTVFTTEELTRFVDCSIR